MLLASSSVEMVYKAFISYSHTTDQRLAPAIQRGLSTFAKPWYRLRTMRIFRDQTNLTATAGLWSSIETALQRSEYFVFLALPGAAKSQWVSREISWWLENRASKKFLIVLTDGSLLWHESSGDFDWECTNSIPRSLSRAFSEEPLYIDVRWARSVEQLSIRHIKFRAAIIDIAATLLSRPRDDLDGAEVNEYRRNLKFAWSAAGALTLLLAISLAATYIAREQQKLALGRLASLCKSLDEAQVLADSSNQGSVYYFQSEFANIADQCKKVDYKAWGN